MSQERIEAAAKALATAEGFEDVAPYERDHATLILAAADAVMFSDEAIERVAVALWNHDFPSHPISDVSELLEWTRERRLEQARLMVAALKGEQ